MMGHNISFYEKYGKLSLNDPYYPFLSGALPHLMKYFSLYPFGFQIDRSWSSTATCFDTEPGVT